MKTRKTNKGKRISNGCKNHGSCDWCKGNRTYSNEHRAPIEDNIGEDYMRLTITEAIQRAEVNKQVYGGEWQVVKTEDKLYVQMVGQCEVPEGGEVEFTTEEDSS